MENAREEAVDAIILLLRHSCTTVRKNAARSVVRFMSVAEDKPLLEALIMMSHGTCREKQTFVWACEAALVRFRVSVQLRVFVRFRAWGLGFRVEGLGCGVWMSWVTHGVGLRISAGLWVYVRGGVA